MNLVYIVSITLISPFRLGFISVFLVLQQPSFFQFYAMLIKKLNIKVRLTVVLCRCHCNVINNIIKH